MKKLAIIILLLAASCVSEDIKNPTYYHVRFVVYYTESHVDTFSFESKGYPSVDGYYGTNNVGGLGGNFMKTTAPIKIIEVTPITK